MTRGSIGPGARDRDDASLRAALTALMADYSIEVSPHDGLDAVQISRLVGSGRPVYVTSLPGRPFDHGLEAAARLARAGLRPVPHLAARRVPSAAALDGFLERLRGEAGVDDLLVIAGDERRPLGPFGDAAAVIESGALARHGIRRIGVAGYPDGHPAIDGAALRAALVRKCAAAARDGIEARIVTQFSFDPARILGFIQDVRSWGCRAPVHVGLAGIARAGTLLKFAQRCGVGASLKMLRAHGRALANLLTVSAPDEALRALAAVPGEMGPVRIHFFPFGGVERTARWAGAIAQGAFTLDGAGLALNDDNDPGRDR